MPVLTLALSLTACQENTAPAASQSRPAQAAVDEIAAPPTTPAVPLPPYVGRWAESKALCPQKWTRLWVDELLTSDQLRCQILPHSAEGGDRTLRMKCIELTKRTREEWRLSYPASDTLKIKREGKRAQTLVRC